MNNIIKSDIATKKAGKRLIYFEEKTNKPIVPSTTVLGNGYATTDIVTPYNFIEMEFHGREVLDDSINIYDYSRKNVSDFLHRCQMLSLREKDKDIYEYIRENLLHNSQIKRDMNIVYNTECALYYHRKYSAINTALFELSNKLYRRLTEKYNNLMSMINTEYLSRFNAYNLSEVCRVSYDIHYSNGIQPYAEFHDWVLFSHGIILNNDTDSNEKKMDMMENRIYAKINTQIAFLYDYFNKHLLNMCSTKITTNEFSEIMQIVSEELIIFKNVLLNITAQTYNDYAYIPYSILRDYISELRVIVECKMHNIVF